MLYPEVERVSPARMVKSVLLMPRVEPPLSVYLWFSQLKGSRDPDMDAGLRVEGVLLRL